MRKCDRFWYETSDPAVGFELEKLDEIRRVTLASLICYNCDVASPIQR